MSRIGRVAGFAGFLAAAFVLTLAPGGVWAALLSMNLKSGIGLPWSVPVALALLWLAWRLAGGEAPWPRSERARARRRANPLDGATFALALVANALALIALASLWVGLKALDRSGGNPLPDFSAYPPWAVALVLSCAAVVGAVAEEVGLRGYVQQRLEGIAPWPAAVALVALFAAPAHALTQGFVWSTFLFYLLADVTYGVTAYLTGSILPGVVAHAAGLLLFFAVIWPRDAALAQSLRTHDTLWALLAIVAVVAGLAVFAFFQLARRTRRLARVPAPAAG
jgi:membrane protease YdiL (CAAX protease family)